MSTPQLIEQTSRNLHHATESVQVRLELDRELLGGLVLGVGLEVQRLDVIQRRIDIAQADQDLGDCLTLLGRQGFNDDAGLAVGGRLGPTGDLLALGCGAAVR